jgi:hypothetical protein
MCEPFEAAQRHTRGEALSGGLAQNDASAAAVPARSRFWTAAATCKFS